MLKEETVHNDIISWLKKTHRLRWRENSLLLTGGYRTRGLTALISTYRSRGLTALIITLWIRYVVPHCSVYKEERKWLQAEDSGSWSKGCSVENDGEHKHKWMLRDTVWHHCKSNHLLLSQITQWQIESSLSMHLFLWVTLWWNVFFLWLIGTRCYTSNQWLTSGRELLILLGWLLWHE